MQFAGNFRQVSFQDVLHTLEQQQRTGKLNIASDNLRAAVYFGGGQWLMAERSGPGQLLAQQFVKAGLVTPEQIEAACSVSFANAGAIPDVQLVRSLISSRTITQEQLRNWAVADAASLISVVLSWPDGNFLFEDGASLPPGRVALPLPIGSVVAQALRRTPTAGPLRETPVLMPEAVVDFVEMDADSGAAVQLTRDQWRMLTAVDGLSSLRMVARNLQAPDGTIIRLASELVAAGIVMVVGTATPAGQG